MEGRRSGVEIGERELSFLDCEEQDIRGKGVCVTEPARQQEQDKFEMCVVVSHPEGNGIDSCTVILLLGTLVEQFRPLCRCQTYWSGVGCLHRRAT